MSENLYAELRSIAATETMDTESSWVDNSLHERRAI